MINSITPLPVPCSAIKKAIFNPLYEVQLVKKVAFMRTYTCHLGLGLAFADD